MLKRSLEPEVMNSAAEAVDYDRMDHSTVNRQFVDDFLTGMAELPVPSGATTQVFDAGTGTAQIPIELIGRGFPAVVTASDMADEMLTVASKNVESRRMQPSIKLVVRDCKQLPEPDGCYDAVMSNSLVHHIPEPRSVLRELWRIVKPSGLFFIRDLCRPATAEAVESVVSRYARDANLHQQQMFLNSLHAALTVEEVRRILHELGISPDAVQMTSDRHWTIRCRKSVENFDREEVFDVVDQADHVLFQAPRSVVHANHWLHRAVHIFVFNSRRELLIHRRSATKDEAPLKYTSSASGHLGAGEDYATAAVRELDEELGLQASVEFLGIFPANGAETSFEHSGLYRAVSDQTPRFDPGEILSGEFHSLAEIDQLIRREPDEFTHCFRSLFHWYTERFPFMDKEIRR